MRRSRVLGAPLLFGFASGCAGASLVAEPLRPADAVPDEDGREEGPGAEQRAVQIERQGGRAWLRDSSGALHGFDPATSRLEAHLHTERVIALHVTPSDRLWALAIDRETDDVRVWERKAAGWRPIVELLGTSGSPIALLEEADAPVVLTTKSIFRLVDGALVGVPLEGGINGLAPTLTHAVRVQDVAYVGTSSSDSRRGSLYRVQLGTGVVERVELACPAGEGGYGDAYTTCAAVTGIVVDPTDPSCVLVSRATTAELSRVCGKKATVASGAWRGLAFEDAKHLGAVMARSAALDDGLSNICSIDPDACPGPRAPVSLGTVVGLSRTERGAWIALPYALVHAEAGGPLTVRIPEYEGRFRVAFERDLVSAGTTARGELCTTSYDGVCNLVAGAPSAPPSNVAASVELPSCWSPTQTNEVLCLDARSYWRSDGARGVVVMRRDTRGAWAADLSPKPDVLAATLYLEGTRGFVVRERSLSRSIGTLLQRVDEADERALLDRAGLD